MSGDDRLALALRINPLSDLAAQALVLVIAVVWLRSPWMIAIWLIRWVVVAASGNYKDGLPGSLHVYLNATR